MYRPVCTLYNWSPSDRYVLLKEKNMLLTTEQESKRQRLQMPGPERLKKVHVYPASGLL